MSHPLKTTQLHAWHQSQGAQMADFGGYEMPLWYGSAKAEHLSVITHAGLFDTSHMAVLLLSGPDSFLLLQQTFTKDLNACIGAKKGPLVVGRSTYGAFLNDAGHCIDDSIIGQLAEQEYMIVVNAGMGGVIAAHLSKQTGFDVEIDDRTDRFGKIDLQGPHAARILAPLLQDADRVFDGLPYFSFKGHFVADSPLSEAVRLTDGTPILLSRTGYTGEFGFELFVPPEATEKVWQQILDAGQPFGITPCGLAARDSLRGGAVLPLSHQDIGDWPFINHPWSFALPLSEDGVTFTKPFIGDIALMTSDAPYTCAFIGKDARKVDTEGAVVLNDDHEEIGQVLTCVTDMAIGRVDDQIVSLGSPECPEDFTPRGLCCGFIQVNRPLPEGASLVLKNGRRQLPVTIVTDVRPDRTARFPLKKMVQP